MLKLNRQLLTVSKQNRQGKTEDSSFMAEMVKNDKRCKGERYLNKLKYIALTVCSKLSNKAYWQLKQHIRLPSVSLLKKWMKCVNNRIEENLLSLLKSKAKLMPQSSRCVVRSPTESYHKAPLLTFDARTPVDS